ncbi:MAG: C39 family peptidase, partial [Planctomycetes bacterium]|nr:C39 family peptidase [Planctomycetota bacterium]
MGSSHRSFVSGILALALVGGGLQAVAVWRNASTAADQTPEKPPRRLTGFTSVMIADVPHIRQKPDFCGEACAAMYLAKLGCAMDQDDVFDQAGLAAEQGRGCFTPELARALTRIGFRVGAVWFNVAAESADQQLQERFRELHTDLKAGVPSILCMRYDDTPDATEHFRLIVGYDDRTDEILYHEP